MRLCRGPACAGGGPWRRRRPRRRAGSRGRSSPSGRPGTASRPQPSGASSIRYPSLRLGEVGGWVRAVSSEGATVSVRPPSKEGRQWNEEGFSGRLPPKSIGPSMAGRWGRRLAEGATPGPWPHLEDPVYLHASTYLSMLTVQRGSSHRMGTLYEGPLFARAPGTACLPPAPSLACSYHPWSGTPKDAKAGPP